MDATPAVKPAGWVPGVPGQWRYPAGTAHALPTAEVVGSTLLKTLCASATKRMLVVVQYSSAKSMGNCEMLEENNRVAKGPHREMRDEKLHENT